jgi:hypothetical protein
VLEVDDSMLQARGRQATCLRSTMACSGLRMRRWHTLRPGSRLAACSKAGDEAAVCSGAGIDDGRRRRCDSV